MEDYYNSSEPLNLVKKKTKPVAVVAPSAILEVGDKKDDVEDLSVKKRGVKKVVCEEKVEEDVNKNCFWDKTGQEVHRPSETRGGAYPLVNFEPNFLTALYMRSLVHSGVIPPGYLGTYPLYPVAAEPQFSPLWAQQRFWQMVQLNEAQKSPKTDSLSIAVPPQAPAAPLKKTAPQPALTTASSKTSSSQPSKKTKQKRYSHSTGVVSLNHSSYFSKFLRFFKMGFIWFNYFSTQVPQLIRLIHKFYLIS